MQSLGRRVADIASVRTRTKRDFCMLVASYNQHHPVQDKKSRTLARKLGANECKDRQAPTGRAD